MNNERFIELLNLYIDRELSGSEIQEIEEALAASPERQRIYAQYCRMQRACEHLLASDVQTAPRPKLDAILAAAQRTDEAEEIVFPAPAAARAIPTEPRATRRQARSSWGWGALSGMAAAVAAFAVYTGTVQTADRGASDIEGVGTVAAAPAPATPASGPAPGTEDDPAALALASNEGSDYRTVLVLESSEDGNSTGLRLANPRPGEDPFAWMQHVQFEPIRPVRLDSLEFRPAEAMEVRNLPAFSYPYPGLDDTPPLSESAAFQFQR